MKNIKFLSVIIIQLFFFQVAIGQSGLDNGRKDGAQPSQVKQDVEEVKKPTDRVITNGNGFSDADVPGAYLGQQQSDWVYPNDLDDKVEELYASASPHEVAARINALEKQLQEIIQYNEQLRLENQAIKKSLNNCCSANANSLKASDAYILQNAPNPFRSVSEISYFIPSDVEGARIDVNSVTGELIHSFKIDQPGFGTVNLKGDILQTGTYVYTLHIANEPIDSKIMVITQ